MPEFLPRRRRVGGLRIDPAKAASTGSPIAEAFVPARLFIPLEAHRGTVPQCCVEPGQRVLKGQRIALGDSAAGSADVHASSSGTIVELTELELFCASGPRTPTCVVIDTDGLDESVAPDTPLHAGASREERLERVRRCGIVGLGGAAMSTSWKLTREQHVATLIVNGAECEPYISCDDMLMRERADGVVAGSRDLCDLIGARRCIVAIERDKPQAIEAIRAAAGTLADPRVHVAEIPSIYPAGGERQLVELLTAQEVPSGGYPTDIGIVCHNVGTALAVHRALRFGEPLISRIVTLTGNGMARPRNVEARIGTAVGDLVAHFGGYDGEPAALIVGGSMMGVAQTSDAVPVTKWTNCVLAAGHYEFGGARTEWPCIRCGECAAACPARLLPQELLRATEAENFALLDTLGLDDCIECGCCDAICPSQIALTRRFAVARQALARRRAAEEFARESQMRFDRRTQRLEAYDDREQASQAALRAQVATRDDSTRAIQAALQRRRNRSRGERDLP